ncbi:UNVERIFIED_CONTAM: hypothetical protein GTU68_032343 [Idotea baltica]|nr:hypothetical protein [Idotea baltica]
MFSPRRDRFSNRSLMFHLDLTKAQKSSSSTTKVETTQNCRVELTSRLPLLLPMLNKNKVEEVVVVDLSEAGLEDDFVVESNRNPMERLEIYF